LAEDRPPHADQRVGNYRLLEQVGSGGMGVVYRAEQLAPVHRIVAIKLVKLGIDTPAVLARFQSERQSLAMLEHPGIARVYDAGTSDTGRPYFVMEYVSGKPIVEYCNQHDLEIESRLRLFEQVCHALQHAHYKGLLHRDLKPSNILGTEIDGVAQVKIIDFGIAKAIEGSSQSPFATQAGEFVGTPVYASPEQIDGREIDTRSDVFSLGVVLYELLSGRLPWDVENVSSQELADSRRSAEPPRPSTRSSATGTTTSLSRRLRGDLDRIVMKAIDRDPAQRYGMAAALAEDIRRHLNHEPIQARPPTLSYQARKFVRRNRVLVAATGMVLGAVIVGAAMAVVGLIRAQQALAREAAARQAEQAQRAAADQVSTFLGDMLGSVDPKQSLGKPVLVRDILDQASAGLDAKFNQQPVVAASLHDILGRTYHGLGLYEKATEHARSALELSQKVHGDDHPSTLEAMRTLAMSLRALYRGKECEALLVDLLQRLRRLKGPDDTETCDAEQRLALVMSDMGRSAEAEPLVTHSLEVHRRKLGPNHVDTLAAMNDMAGIESALGKFKEAEVLYRELNEGRRGILGDDHPWTIQSEANLGMCILKQRRYAEAEPILRDTLARSERVQGPDHARTLDIANALAVALRLQERMDDAVAMLREIADRSRRSLPPNHPDTILAVGNLALILDQQDKPNEALVCYEECYRGVQVAELSPKRAAQYTAAYGLCLVKLKRYAEAEQSLLEARRHMEAADMAGSGNMQRVFMALAQVCQATNRPVEAEEWRALAKKLNPSSSPATTGPRS
jgi:non-specific serine/threonine protein kinase/serine/threonine-protein kinase